MDIISLKHRYFLIVSLKFNKRYKRPKISIFGWKICMFDLRLLTLCDSCSSKPLRGNGGFKLWQSWSVFLKLWAACKGSAGALLPWCRSLLVRIAVPEMVQILVRIAACTGRVQSDRGATT